MTTVDFSRVPRPVLGAHPEWIRLYWKAWELAARNIRRGRGGRLYMDCAWDPSRNYQWVWDTCFMCMYCRYAADQYPGIQSLDNFYDMQREDGYISMTYDMDNGQEPWPNRINPPLFAWTEWEYTRATGDRSRLERAASHIERLMDWIDRNRRNLPHRRHRALDGVQEGRGESHDLFSLYFFEDCGSSGMDDSPRTPRVTQAGQFYDWIDLSSQMALSFSMLGRMHQAAGHADAAAKWNRRANELGALINDELWCERTRFYHDRTLPKNFINHKTAAGFWPLLAGICPPDRVDALVGHLLDPREFYRPTPIPSLSADDPNYTPEGVYWTGGVWAPTNYMILRGLTTAGRTEIAHELAERYLGVLARTFETEEPHTLWEAYSPEADRPGLAAYTRDRVKPDFVGWTGVGPIAMLIESILGIEADALEGAVTWDIRQISEHGIDGLSVGPNQRIDLRCAPRLSAADPATLTVRSDRSVELKIRCAGRSMTVPIRGGVPFEGKI